jgi:acyl-coenzyme A thioesterase PaaI-like protein
MKAFKLLKKFLNRQDKLSLIAVDNILKIAIPFNAPHGFSIQSVEGDIVRIKIPNRKLNQNHLGGVHACAIATLGEFCAGMTIAKQLGLDEYRLILKQLSVDYLLQGRTDLIGESRLSNEQCDLIKNQLSQNDKILVDQKTDIFNAKNELVAVVTTKWQLKNWNQVQLK